MDLQIVNEKILVYYYDDYFIIKSEKYNKALEVKMESFGNKTIHVSENSWCVSNDLFDCFMKWTDSNRETIFICIERFDSECNNTQDSDDDYFNS